MVRMVIVSELVLKNIGVEPVEVLSSFLSPLANKRDDDYGGSLENRAKLLLKVYNAVREEVGPSFPIGVKLNSADFQKGGSTEEEAKEVAHWLDLAGVDVIEISGGNMETMSTMGFDRTSSNKDKPKSTREREAYFLDYAEVISKGVKSAKLMVTGGFREKTTMEYAMNQAGVDFIGLGRPFLYLKDPVNALLSGEVSSLPNYESGTQMIRWYYRPLTLWMPVSKLNALLALVPAMANMLRVGEGKEWQGNPNQVSLRDVLKYIRLLDQNLKELKGIDCKGTKYMKP